MFVSASKDCSAKLFDIEDLSVLKTYQTERPVNSASISPLYDHVGLILIFVVTQKRAKCNILVFSLRLHWVVVKKLWK